MERIAGKVRSDDSVRLMQAILKIANIPDANYELEDKTNRGFNNPHTAELLVPIEYLEEYHSDPEG